MLIYLGMAVLPAFALALGLAGQGWRAAAVHAAFALGAMPLIFGAMGHFVPVLCRRGGIRGPVARLPLLMQLTGGLVVAVLAGILPGGGLLPALGLGLLGVGWMLVWVGREGRASLGQPHPGLRWYQAALVCLALALLALLVGLAFPAAWPGLRHAHLHLNTLGFMGLTALGTLQVLMPTVLGQPDPAVAGRLRRHLGPALAGVAGLALGGLWAPLAWGGALAYGAVVALMVVAWLRAYGLVRIARDGAACALLVASLGLLLQVLAGLAHGGAAAAEAGFIGGFVLPLVTGALSQLLPVWRLPGPRSPARDALRARLVRGGQGRALLFGVGGGLLLMGWMPGAVLVALGGADFALRAVWALARVPRAG
ncbi:hypothetical protein [Zoogloea sp.]|uniref:hypothetical protein n=2 Tax=Zoogloea sp. TaxID=49181 RepID=UPI0035B1F1F9